MTEYEQLLAQVAVKARETRPWDRPAPPGPADAATLARAEAALGFELPPLLAELYRRTADGGFGPGHGLLPLLDGAPSDDEPAAVAQYPANRENGREDPDWPWPEGVLPISHWGCGMYACVDCRSPQATVLLFEPNADDSHHTWFVDTPSLADWSRSWTDGTGWYEEENEGADLTLWTDYSHRVTAAHTS
ncbi:SMI1/KNR4 family protein [Streptomyces sp. NPDC058442]|uniref:SMI1/KNR4 family protein n=1 Tax=Streptomyces sp. NPDC058442 TaxID=3346503 RepID=UPI003660CC6E